MNLSAAFLAERYMKEWDKVMPYVDILFGNENVSQTKLCKLTLPNQFSSQMYVFNKSSMYLI